jgi:hypothetical protein
VRPNVQLFYDGVPGEHRRPTSGGAGPAAPRCGTGRAAGAHLEWAEVVGRLMRLQRQAQLIELLVGHLE